MAIRKISEALESEIDAAGSRYVFKALADTPNDSLESIKADPLCPKEGQPDPYNFLKTITGVQVRRASQDTKSGVWLITVVSAVQPLAFINPVDEPAAITLNTEQYEKMTCFDGKGQPILNKAGSLMFVPIEQTRYSFTVRKNVYTIPLSLINSANKINSGLTMVNGLPCPEGTLMVKGIQGGEMQTVPYGTGYIRYLQLSFTLVYREEGWDIEYPNVGFEAYYDEPVWEFIKDAKGKKTNRVKIDPKTKRGIYNVQRLKRRITTATGDPVSEPQMLDANGYIVDDPDASKLIKLKAEPYERIDFNQFPLY